MYRAVILLSLFLFSPSAANACQGGGGESTKTKPAARKKTSGSKAATTKITRPTVTPSQQRTKTITATSELIVRTTPPNSLVMIDGESVGVTDDNGLLSLPSFKPGVYVISVLREGYQKASKDITLSAGGNEMLAFDLAAATQVINIASSPPDCEVYVDGVLRGKTDSSGQATFPDVALGEHKITIRKPRYRDAEYPLAISSDKAGLINAKLELAVGFLTITTNVPNASIDVSGIGRFNTPISKTEVPTGTYSVIISSPIHITSKQSFSISPGQETQLSVDLEIDPAARNRLVADATNAFSRDDFSSFRTLAEQAIRAGGSLEFKLAHNDNWVGSPLHPIKLTLSATNFAFDPQVAEELKCSFRKFNLPIGTLLNVQVEETSGGIFSKPAGTYLKLVLQNPSNAKKPFTLNFADRGSSVVNDGRGHESLNSRSNARQALSAVAFVIEIAMRSAR